MHQHEIHALLASNNPHWLWKLHAVT